MNKKGQVATEYMLLIGVLLVIVALLSAYSFFVYNETIASKHLNNSLKNLKQGVNNVYYLGNGNSMVVEIIFPNGVSDISLSGSAIIVTKEDEECVKIWLLGTSCTTKIYAGQVFKGDIVYVSGGYLTTLHNTSRLIFYLRNRAHTFYY